MLYNSSVLDWNPKLRLRFTILALHVLKKMDWLLQFSLTVHKLAGRQKIPFWTLNFLNNPKIQKQCKNVWFITYQST